MMRAWKLAVLIPVAAIGGALAHRQLASGDLVRPDEAMFTLQDIRWDRTELDNYRAIRGTARVVGNEASQRAPYLVLVQFIRSRRLNPSDTVDTLVATAMTVNGLAQVTAEDRAYRCTGIMRPPACAREFAAGESRFELVGWARITAPAER